MFTVLQPDPEFQDLQDHLHPEQHLWPDEFLLKLLRQGYNLRHCLHILSGQQNKTNLEKRSKTEHPCARISI